MGVKVMGSPKIMFGLRKLLEIFLLGFEKMMRPVEKMFGKKTFVKLFF